MDNKLPSQDLIKKYLLSLNKKVVYIDIKSLHYSEDQVKVFYLITKKRKKIGIIEDIKYDHIYNQIRRNKITHIKKKIKYNKIKKLWSYLIPKT